METYNAIYKRRSIRKYKDTDVSESIIKKILSAGLQAPSSKNKQPWKFIVTKGKSKYGALEAMKDGIEKAKMGAGLLPTRQQLIPSVEHTLQVMRQSPAVIFVFNTEEQNVPGAVSAEENFVITSNILSIGAAIENMLIMATDLGVASLWICDIVFAYSELCAYFGEPDQLISAIALGYADEKPWKISKKSLDSVVKWR